MAAAIVFASLFFLMPIYVMLVTGLKSADNVSLSTMWQLPSPITGGAFLEAWDRLASSMRNSFIVTIPATALSCMIGSINGYLLSKWRFRFSNVVFIAIVFGMFIPFQSVLIPLIKTLQFLGLYGSLLGLILVHTIYGMAVTTLIFRNFYVNIPNELIDAGRVDGAGVLGIFRHIVLPISIPAFVVGAIFQFTGIWNDFLFGLVVTPDPRVQPVMIALNNLSSTFSVAWNVLMAGALVAALPTAILYLVLGRYFISGLTAGSVKG
jgi:glucose/mannose transport system permease protein